MQRREKILLAGLALSVLLWQGRGWFGTLFAPITERQQEVSQLKGRVERAEEQHLAVVAATRQLGRWKAQSLPPDPFNAQRLYQQWLTDLGQLVGITGLQVSPGRRSPAGDTYTAVQVSIEGRATYDQFVRFVDYVQQVDLLHRLSWVTVDTESNDGDPMLDVTLVAEGLSLNDAAPRTFLFPQATLAEDLRPGQTTLRVKDADVFPEKTPFVVRIGSEFCNVTKVSAATWTAQRAAQGTAESTHPANEIVELFPIATDADPSELPSPFAKPRPPIEYRPRLLPVGDRTVVRGDSLRFTVRGSGFDPTWGALRYELGDDPPPGSNIDPKTGAFEWAPDESTPSGDYEVTVRVSPAERPEPELSETVTLTLRDPNSPPLLAPTDDQTVYFGQTLTFSVFALDTDNNDLAFRLEDAPEGATIDAQTGEFRWTPSESVEPADYEVTITVTDNGEPPLSDSQTVMILMDDDAARFTFLVACINRDGREQAWLFDRLNNRRIVVHEAETLKLAGIEAQVRSIGRDFVLLEFDDATWQLDLGEHLRSLTKRDTPPTAADSAVLAPKPSPRVPYE